MTSLDDSANIPCIDLGRADHQRIYRHLQKYYARQVCITWICGYYCMIQFTQLTAQAQMQNKIELEFASKT